MWSYSFHEGNSCNLRRVQGFPLPDFTCGFGHICAVFTVAAWSADDYTEILIYCGIYCPAIQRTFSQSVIVKYSFVCNWMDGGFRWLFMYGRWMGVWMRGVLLLLSAWHGWPWGCGRSRGVRAWVWFSLGVVRYGGGFYCYFLFVLLGWALTFLIFPNFLRFYVLRHSAACEVIRIYHVYK